MVIFDYKKTPITQVADYIITYSAKSGASDIHFDPRENGLMVRIRIDGDLRDYTLVPEDYERNLVTRLKLLANMNITESRLPQDGAIKGQFGNLYLDMRVSCLPTNEGEKIVIRILDYSRSLQGLEYLGFSHTNFLKLKRMIAEPNGIVLVTGATGSGKSTTTYSILQSLNKKEVNIITVEDPVEMNIEGLNQVQVNSEIGLDFATVLRSILRQDPNVILIGEIRDSETAKIAVRASITGHFVLSTIHTNNSLSTIERLLDMNVERYLLSTALTGIISQRLAKRLCPKCKISRETTKYEKKIFKKALGKEITTVYDANKNGCSECHNGYRGRIAIQEVLEIDDDIRLAINNEHLTKEELRKLVYTSNVITLLQDGLYKVLDGITSFEEIYRIIEIDSDDEDDYTTELEEIETEKSAKESNKNMTISTNTSVLNNTTSIIQKENSIDNTDIKNTAATLTTDTSSLINQNNAINKNSEPVLIELPKVDVKIENEALKQSNPIIKEEIKVEQNNNQNEQK
ncbi:MAG: GspE/PulE family protein [bacterium]|nr:GspE/PulE family protein [bacterium]